MLTIIDFFRKKGDFRRNFIFQCGINHTPFVTVLSFEQGKRNAATAQRPPPTVSLYEYLQFTEVAEHLFVLVGTSPFFASQAFCFVSAGLFCVGEILCLEKTPLGIISTIPCLEKALLCIICTIPCLEKTPLGIISTLAFLVYGDVDFLLPSHIAFPRFVVRLVPPNIEKHLTYIKCEMWNVWCEIYYYKLF